MNMTMRTSPNHLNRSRSIFRSLTIPGPAQILFFLLILSCVYDKSGLIINLGSKGISISFYKVIFLILLVVCFIDPISVRRSPLKMPGINRGLYKLIVLFIVVQTGASLLGLVVAPGAVSLPSEVYYLIQRSSFLFIPYMALRYRISPQLVLKLFLGAIFIHQAFVLLQFMSLDAYGAFAEFVNDPYRLDSAVAWYKAPDDRWNFIGLQNTSNYGTFVGSLGLLMLGFIPQKRFFQLIRWGILTFAIFIFVLGPSRSVFFLGLVTLFLFYYCIGFFTRFSTYVKMVILAFFLIWVIILGFWSFRVTDFTAIEALLMPLTREGSNQGKFAIARYGMQLAEISPLVGWGQRRFADISRPLGNTSSYMSEVHSFYLNTLLSSGMIGLMAYGILSLSILKALRRSKSRENIILYSLFVGLNLYNIIYDAGGLDVFACLNGVVAYHALFASSGYAIKVSNKRKDPPLIRSQPHYVR